MAGGVIGPVTLERVSLRDNNIFKSEKELKIEGHRVSQTKPKKTEEFQLLVSHEEAIHLQGLNDWEELFYINTSPSLSLNSRQIHRGYYLLNFKEPEYRIADALITVEAICLSKDPNQLLKMDYSIGVNDGTLIESDYEDLVPTTIFEEAFTTFDTTNVWKPLVATGVTGHSIAVSGGKLVFTAQASVGGTIGGMITELRQMINTDFICDFDLELVAALPSGYNSFGIYLTESANLTWSNLHVIAPNTNWFRLQIEANSGGGAGIKIDREIKGQGTNLVTNSITSAQKTPKFRIKYFKSGEMEIWINKSGTAITEDTTAGDIRLMPKTNLGLVFKDFVHMMLDMSTSYATAPQVFKINNLKFWRNSESEKHNVVCMLVDAIDKTPATSTRDTEWGIINCYLNPTQELKMHINTDKIHSGGVQLFDTTGTPKRIFNSDTFLYPGFHYITNGIIKLEVTTTGIKVWRWLGWGWEFKKEFNIGTIKFAKILLLNGMVCRLQLDETVITLRHGRMGFYWEHPTENLYFTPFRTYIHDGATLTGVTADDVDITMEDVNHCEMYGFDNLAPTNVANGCEDGTTSGWVAQGDSTTATLYYSTAQHYNGSSSLRVVTGVVNHNEGAGFNVTGLTIGKTYYVRFMVWALQTFTLNLICGANTIPFTTSAGAWQIIEYDFVATSTSHNPRVVRPGTDVTFYLDQVMFVDLGGYTRPTAAEVNTVTGDFEEAYRLQIVKDSPTTIKSNYIPASALTIINCYNSTISNTGHINYYLNVAREMHLQTIQSIDIAKP